ncbi:glycosyltransferase [Tsuneonella troitsensis]|uniref:glycosyltransferase n=1 Tax=Tsuneonella troitsensis TaxID=292222 RepID=UPI000709D5D2|nr:glycosyltransferase family 2 protein [Tsuneonella troitsensis]
MISVILPSRNGADTLPDVLAALENLAAPRDGYEILLVDSASDDDITSAMLRDFAHRHERASLITEPVAGKSRALNRAIEQAQGELLVFLDDDMVVAPHWLLEYTAAAERHSAAGLFAGAILPRWRSPPSAWLAGLAAEGRSCGATPASTPEGPCRPQLLKGGNFAIRRKTLGAHRFGGGGADFGSPGAMGGEDTDLATRAVTSGAVLVFVPQAVAEHIVQPEEMTPAAVFARYRRIGGSQSVRRPRLIAAIADSLAVALFGTAAAGNFLIGRRVAAARNLTRLASRSGRLGSLLRP